jgi:ribonuclease BN (tRNA processing enzyme)
MNKIGASRRSLLTAVPAASALAALAAVRPAHAASPPSCVAQERERVQAALKGRKGTTLVLLGTGGGPIPGRARHMTSHVLLHGDAAYIVDCGLGVTDRFTQTGIPFGNIRSIFITHHHPDHNIEYGPFLVLGWVRGLNQSVNAYGPPPLTQMTADYLKSMQTTVHFWAEDFHMTPLTAVTTHDLPEPGPVMEDENVKVTCVQVQHPPVTPAYGYRFDFNDRSIAFSGDTVPLERVAEMAKRADVLVHEAINMSAIEDEVRLQIASGQHVSFDTFMAHMRADHSPIEDVGRIAQEAGVKTLVLSHLSPSQSSLSDETWAAPAAKYFKGQIVVGHDLMVV